jgi:hypothetical protein
MDYGPEKWQWAMLVKVLHGSVYGHRIEIETRTKGRESHAQPAGTWRGLGIPEPVLTCARAQLDVIFTEHLITRYGVRGELPLKWSGEPDPF